MVLSPRGKDKHSLFITQQFKVIGGAATPAIHTKRRYNMTIEKNGTVYIVNETPTGWTLTTSLGNVGVSFNITMADCPTFETRKEFVAESDAI